MQQPHAVPLSLWGGSGCCNTSLQVAHKLCWESLPFQKKYCLFPLCVWISTSTYLQINSHPDQLPPPDSARWTVNDGLHITGGPHWPIARAILKRCLLELQLIALATRKRADHSDPICPRKHNCLQQGGVRQRAQHLSREKAVISEHPCAFRCKIALPLITSCQEIASDISEGAESWRELACSQTPLLSSKNSSCWRSITLPFRQGKIICKLYIFCSKVMAGRLQAVISPRAEDTEVESTHIDWHVHPEKGTNEDIRNLLWCFGKTAHLQVIFLPPNK